MRVLLVYPYYPYETVSTYEEPVGILYLASALSNAGHDVDVLDLTFNKDLIGLDEKTSWADIVGISSPTPLFGTADIVLKEVRKVCPGITTIVGGPHATASPMDALGAGFDIAVIGEGEVTLVELVEAIENNQSIKNVPGIAFIENNRLVLTPKRPFIDDLDEIAFPDRRFIDYSHYRRIGIISMRGCPYRCIYCKPVEDKLFGKKLRKRSVENVVEEISQLFKQFGNRQISFKDDTLTVNTTRWFEMLLEGFKEKNINVSWQCSSRVDTVDITKLQAMKNAGCRQIFFGIESGSQKVLDYYRKDIKVEKIIETFSLCHTVGIRPAASIMMGAPIETKEDLDKTFLLVKKIKPFNWHVHVTTPIYGSYLFDQALAENRIKPEIEYSSCAPTGNMYKLNLPMALDHLTVEDIAKYRDRINRYMKFRVIFNCLFDFKILKEFLFSKGLRTIVFNFLIRHFNPFYKNASWSRKQ